MADDALIRDPWSKLRRHTTARIALGRAGGSLPTAELLRFAMDHAEARDAVAAELDLDALEKALGSAALPIVRVESDALDRLTYLQRPDLGRRLSESARERLHRQTAESPDIVLIVADGLSALAARTQAPPLLEALLPMLRASRFCLAPLVLARHARVAIEDEIGSILGTRCAVILLGERPGLGSADSLGAYLVYAPQPGNTDALRNCVSNIRPAGLSPAAAAETIHHLIVESLRRQISGVGLSDEREVRSLPSVER